MSASIVDLMEAEMSFRYWRRPHIGPLKNAIAPQGDGDAVILLIWLVAMLPSPAFSSRQCAEGLRSVEAR